ncbi:RNA-binding protein 14-like [Crotalus adamanteus]|uniref:RNA-binding protein 14-like n=1 Tax=Crotalus adamanteus TaxID=8729 RepID=A0AAW1C222_CROAD
MQFIHIKGFAISSFLLSRGSNPASDRKSVQTRGARCGGVRGRRARGAPRVELRDLFEAAVPGVVVKVALKKQFAFIQLCDEVAAECAIQKLNGHLLHCHRMVVVEFSRPRPTHTVKTFVGNVSATCTSGELRVLFQEFGPVIECHIVKGVAVGAGGRTEIDP